MENEIKAVIKDMANLLADLSETTADLVHDSASHMQGDLVDALAIKRGHFATERRHCAKLQTKFGQSRVSR